MTDRDNPGVNRAARIVADADVLAADLLVGNHSRDALDVVRRHDWITLVASEPLLDDATTIIERLASASLARDWRVNITEEAAIVTHPAGDHPALGAAMQGTAGHLLSLDDRLTSAGANRTLQSRMAVSVRTPTAFVRLFDPAPLYESLFGESYPGPDADPSA